MRFLLVLLAFLALNVPHLDAAGDLSGRRAPGFTLPDGNMQYHDLADYRGKVVLLEIMVSRCPNCQMLAQTLEKMKAKYGDRIAVLGVVNPPDNKPTVMKFKADFKITSPILFDCGQMVASYLMPNPQRPRIHVPHLFLIDAKGMIRKDFDQTNTAIFKGQGLAEEIDRLLQ